MEIKKMKIDQLVEPERNVRVHSDIQIREIKRSVEKFGQFRLVVIDEKNEILAGNGLVRAMREMGVEEVDVLQYTDLSEANKKKLMLADNQLAELGADNYNVIEQFIHELSDDLDIPGFDENALQAMIYTPEETTEEISAYGKLQADEIEHIQKNEVRLQNPQQVEQTYQQTENRKILNALENEQEIESVQYDTQKYVICPHCGQKIYLES